MIRYKLTEPPPRIPFPSFVPEEAFVTVRATGLDEIGAIEFEGPVRLVARSRKLIAYAADAEDRDGVPSTTPRRLAMGMLHDSALQRYTPELIIGREIRAQDR